jgi:hypothetical protein
LRSFFFCARDFFTSRFKHDPKKGLPLSGKYHAQRTTLPVYAVIGKRADAAA